MEGKIAFSRNKSRPNGKHPLGNMQILFVYMYECHNLCRSDGVCYSQNQTLSLTSWFSGEKKPKVCWQADLGKQRLRMKELSLLFKPQPCFFNVFVFLPLMTHPLSGEEKDHSRHLGKTQNAEIHKWHVSSWFEGPLTRGQMLQWSKWQKEKKNWSPKEVGTICLSACVEAGAVAGSPGRARQAVARGRDVNGPFSHTPTTIWNFESQNYTFIHNSYTTIGLFWTGSHICILRFLQKVQLPVEFHRQTFINTNIGLLPLPLKDGAHKITESCPWQPNGVVDVSVRVKLSLLASHRELFFNNLDLFHIYPSGREPTESHWRKLIGKVIGWDRLSRMLTQNGYRRVQASPSVASQELNLLSVYIKRQVRP